MQSVKIRVNLIVTAILLVMFTPLTPLEDELQAQVQNPSGEPVYASDSDIWPNTMRGSHFNEFWSYHFYLNDGIKVNVDFTMANFGRIKSAISGVRVSVHNFDGELYQVAREYPLERLVRDRDRYMLRNHPDRDVWFEGKLPEEHRVRVYTTKDGITYDIDLHFDEIVPGVRWHDGKFHIDGDEIGIITHIPYAKVRGEVGINDTRKRVEGTAYMDHTFYDERTTRVMRSAYRYISHRSEVDWDIFYFMMPRDDSGHETVGYRLSRRGGDRKLDGIVRMEVLNRSSAFNRRLGQHLRLELESGESIEIERKADQERNSFLAELGSIARRAARAYLGGEVVVYRGEADLIQTGENRRHVDYNLLIVE